MPRPLFEDPYAAQAISLLQDPARARADAVRQIADAQARATTVAGNAQAGAQVAGGQAWAGAAQQIGQSVGQIPNDILKAQQQSQQLAMQKLQQQNITSEINQRDQKMRQDAELRATQQNIGRMMASPDVFDQDTGLLNAKSIASKMSAQNANYNGPTEPPDMAKIYGLIDPINESLTKAADARRVAGEHTTNALAHIASTSLTIGKDNGGDYFSPAQLGIAAAVRSGVITQDQATPMLMSMIQNKDGIPDMLKGVAARSTVAPIKLGAEDRLMSGIDPTQTLVGAQGKPGEGQHVINGQLVGPDGKPIGAQIPKETDPAAEALKAAQLREINAKLDGSIPLTAKDKAELDIQRAKLANENKAAAEKNKPFDVTADIRTTMSGGKYLDPSAYVGAERNKVIDAAKLAGVTVVTKDQADSLQNVDNARANQRDIMSQIESILPADAAARPGAYVATKLEKMFQTNDQVAAFNSWRTAAINSMRATAGSKGLRINRAEIEQAVENDIPRLTDTIGTARQKVANVNKMLDNVESSIVVRDRSGASSQTSGPMPKVLRYNQATGKVE